MIKIGFVALALFGVLYLINTYVPGWQLKNVSFYGMHLSYALIAIGAVLCVGLMKLHAK